MNKLPVNIALIKSALFGTLILTKTIPNNNAIGQIPLLTKGNRKINSSKGGASSTAKKNNSTIPIEANSF